MTERTDWQDKESQDDLEGGQDRTKSGTDWTSGAGGGSGGSSGTGGEMTQDPRTGSTDYGTPMGGSQGDLGEGGVGSGGTGFEQDRMAGGGGGTGFEEGTTEGGAGNRSGSGSGGQGESAMYDEEEGDGGIGTTGA